MGCRKRLVFLLFLLVPLVSAQSTGPGDVNEDGMVDLNDLIMMTVNLGDSGFDVRTDLNADGRVNIFDMVVVARNYGNDYTGSTLPQGLIAAYPFEENTGTTTSDVTGNYGDLVFNGNPTWTAGQYGNAISFDGVDDYLYLDITDRSGPFTVTLWAQSNSATQAGNTGFFASTDNWQLPNTFQLEFSRTFANCLGDFSLLATDSSGNAFNACLSTPSTNWIHLAATFDGTTIITYQDGVQQNTTVQSFTGLIELFKVGTNRGSGSYFDGVIDEVRIYDRALSASEVNNDRNNPTSGGSPPPSCECSGMACEAPGNTGRVCDGCNYTAAPAEVCEGSVDENCDGQVDEGCPSCTCDDWTDTSCGAGSCASDEMQQTRTCTPVACLAETQCVSDASCSPPPPPVCNNNGTCDTGVGETCSNCPNDCGICSDPGVVFWSDFRAELGTTNAAQTDGGKWNGNDNSGIIGGNSRENLIIITAPSSIDWPSINVMLTRDFQNEGEGQGGGRFPLVDNVWNVPQIGESLYYRWYIRAIEGPMSPQNIHPIHVVPSVGGPWFVGAGVGIIEPPSGTTGHPNPRPDQWYMRFAIYNAETGGPFALPDPYWDTDVTYRVEVALTRTGTDTATYDARVYTRDSNGQETLWKTGENFFNQAGQGPVNMVDYGDIGLRGQANVLDRFTCGVNGIDLPRGTFDIFYQGAFAICRDTWCGSYPIAGVED